MSLRKQVNGQKLVIYKKRLSVADNRFITAGCSHLTTLGNYCPFVFLERLTISEMLRTVIVGIAS
jgi:hypothetical protein